MTLLAALGIVLLAVGVAVWLVRDYRHYRIGDGNGPISKVLYGRDRRRRQRDAKTVGCTASYHVPGRHHGKCVDCGQWTCERAMRVEPTTLRRRMLHVCGDCNLREMRHARDDHARTLRTRFDWERYTEEPDMSLIDTGAFGDQYPGRTREAIRAFINANVTEAIVEGSAVTYNQSIAVLGLKEIYAETRNEKTYLRKVPTTVERPKSKRRVS